MADYGIIYIRYLLREELKIYAYLLDKDTNGKAFRLHLRFTKGCSFMEDVLNTNFSAPQQRI